MWLSCSALLNFFYDKHMNIRNSLNLTMHLVGHAEFLSDTCWRLRAPDLQGECVAGTRCVVDWNQYSQLLLLLSLAVCASQW